ncbi:MAG: 2-amino-4-hydroxy-6-hydroxymethyldihydropteridine diphosphokinase [Rudaea sp.]
MASVYIGLGSNLNDPHAQVEAGLLALSTLPDSHLLRRSRLYDTAPWGRTNQPAFVNAVAQLETALAPRVLLDALLAVERAAGRERDITRWGPRVLDLDILVYANLRVDEPGLHLPHPHLHERAFVLVPLSEIAPELHVPGCGRVDALLARLDAADGETADARTRVAE